MIGSVSGTFSRVIYLLTSLARPSRSIYGAHFLPGTVLGTGASMVSTALALPPGAWCTGSGCAAGKCVLITTAVLGLRGQFFSYKKKGFVLLPSVSPIDCSQCH